MGNDKGVEWSVRKRLASERMRNGKLEVLCSLCNTWKVANGNFCVDNRTLVYVKRCNECRKAYFVEYKKTPNGKAANKRHTEKQKKSGYSKMYANSKMYRDVRIKYTSDKKHDIYIMKNHRVIVNKLISMGIIEKQALCNKCGRRPTYSHVAEDEVRMDNIQFLCKTHLAESIALKKRVRSRRMSRLINADPELYNLIIENTKKRADEARFWTKVNTNLNKFCEGRDKEIFRRRANLEYLFSDWPTHERKRKVDSIIEKEKSEGLL